MKYIISIISMVGIVLILCLCGLNTAPQTTEYLRIHIRANSNSEADQAVKYIVKDAVVDALIPILSEVETKSEAVETLTQNFSLIEKVADAVLNEYGFDYSSHARIDNEYFPTRTYESNGVTLTLEEGDYDALILDLGTGKGNNWWCVVYPAFCFTHSKNFDNFVYISKILEILQGGRKS